MIIAAAGIACLYNRHAMASAAGATRLAQELTHRIGEMQTSCREFAGARAIFAVVAGAD
jgi:hypothetical protein